MELTAMTRIIKGVLFEEGEAIVVKGLDFTVLAIGKRSLILQPISPSPDRSSEPRGVRPAADSPGMGEVTTTKQTTNEKQNTDDRKKECPA